MQPVFAKIHAACDNHRPVLVSGEAGTGKELVARTIHYNGLRKDGPFVPLNCSAPAPDLIESELFGHVKGAFAGATTEFEGLLRAAEGGTIFLDEIADLPTDSQAKLVRGLEEKRVRPVGSTRKVPVNVRVIAATNLNPTAAIAEGRLRRDLFYRLGVINIEVPPLRERKEDIPFLVSNARLPWAPDRSCRPATCPSWSAVRPSRFARALSRPTWPWTQSWPPWSGVLSWRPCGGRAVSEAGPLKRSVSHAAGSIAAWKH